MAGTTKNAKLPLQTSHGSGEVTRKYGVVGDDPGLLRFLGISTTKEEHNSVSRDAGRGNSSSARLTLLFGTVFPLRAKVPFSLFPPTMSSAIITIWDLTRVESSGLPDHCRSGNKSRPREGG